MRAINSGDEILAKQDEDENIELLKAQRQLYSDAKVLKYWYSALSLGAPILAVVVQLWMGQGWTMPPAMYIMIELVILFIIVEYLAKKKTEKTELAAKIQQNFDSRIFGVSFECSDVPPKIIEKYATKYDSKGKSIQPSCPWYTSAIAGLASDKAVELCQKENVQWTRNLSHHYSLFVRIVCLTVIASVVILIAVMHVNPASCCFILPPFIWACRELHGSRNYISALDKLESWESLKFDSVHNINEFQKRIFDYRKSSILVPDRLYEKRRETEETKAAKVIKIGLRS